VDDEGREIQAQLRTAPSGHVRSGHVRATFDLDALSAKVVVSPPT
jgi:hypothetical protein